jgi:hypothetical protein
MRLIWLMMVSVAAACSQPNPVVCCSSPADCNSIGASEQTRPCVDGFVCIAHECASAPPVDAAPACTVDSDCPTAAPHCANNSCVQCVSSDQCAAAIPVCDASTNSCRACAADSECGSNVCEPSNGTCIDAGMVLYASPSGGDSAACTYAAPCSLTHALASVSPTQTVVKMLPGNYTTNVALSGTTTVWIDGEGAMLTAQSPSIGIEISDGAKVRVTGLKLVDLNMDATGNVATIRCDSASSATPTLELDGVSVDTDVVAVFAQPCTLTATRSSFHVRNPVPATISAYAGPNGQTTAVFDRCIFDGGDGVQSIYGSTTVTVSNSLLENMTGVDGAMIGGTLLNGSNGRLFASFDTLVDASLKCPAGTPACNGGTAAGVCIDNSIVTAATGDAITGSACVVNYGLAFPQSGPVTGAHNMTNVDPRFLDAAHGMYSLNATSPAIDAADPTATDGPDLVGISRPQGPRDDLGAYEYKP